MPFDLFSSRSQQELELSVIRDCEATAEVTQRRPVTVDRSRPDPSTMTTAQLLTAMLGRSSERLCAKFITGYPSLRKLAGAHPADLRDLGATPAVIEKLAVVFEIARRHNEEELLPGQPFRGSRDIYAHFRERLAAEHQEHFIAVLLDNKNRMIRDVVVALGSLTSSIVHPRDVYHRVVRDAAAAVIFVHNHPSGDPTPSREDIEITRRLRDVGELVGVRVLDHIVIGAGRYVSFVDDGFW